MKVIFGLAIGIVALCVLLLPVTDTVTGVVLDAGERQSYISYRESRRFIGVTIATYDGTPYNGAIPIDDGGPVNDFVHDFLPGDVVTMKLNRTAYRTTIGSHVVKEKDGTVRLVESTTVGWRLIKQYKIEKRPALEAK